MKRSLILSGIAAAVMASALSFSVLAQEDASRRSNARIKTSETNALVERSESDPAEGKNDAEESASVRGKDDSNKVVQGRKRAVLKADASIQAGSEKDELSQDSAENEVPREIVGREIADYRTTSGEGKYVMEDEFGVLRMIPGAAIESIEDAPDVTLGELRENIAKRLLKEFGKNFSTKTSKDYIFVYDASDGYAEWCARLFENLTDGFNKYAQHNGFKLKERVEPMVVVIFATKGEFVRYASKETPSADKVAAYYNMETNRVVLYDLSQTEGTINAPTRRKRAFLETKEFLSRPNAAFNVATIVHEATHQLAYNRGLFQRTGPFALWTVEGLSLVFETPNGKVSQDGWGYRGSFPKNERQLAFFKKFASATTQREPLRDLIRQDKFMVDLQGSYSMSWALFYYLYKKRPKDLAAYITEIADRPPCTVYSPEDRVADFEKYFGDDWEKLTENLLRFVKKM